MEALLSLLGIVVMIAIVVSPIIALVKLGSFRAKIDDMQFKLDALRAMLNARAPQPRAPAAANPPPPPAAAPAPAAKPIALKPPIPAPLPKPAPLPPPAPASIPPETGSGLDGKVAAIVGKAVDWFAVRGEFAPKGETWEYGLATNWLLRIGVLIVIGGVLFFLRWSVEHGILGPTGRVAISLAIGVALIGAGSRMLFKRYHLIAQGLCCIGFVTLYFGFYAAVNWYKLMPAFGGLAAFVCVTAGAGVFAVAYRSAAIATLGLIGGYLAPVLMTTGSENDIAFYIYLTVLAVGALAVSRLRKWPALNILAMLAGYTLSASFCAEHGGRAFLFRGFIFFSLVHIFYLATVWFQKREAGRRVNAAGWVAICLNAGIYLTWMMSAFRPVFSDEWVGFAFIVAVAVYVALLYAELGRKTHDAVAVRVMAAIAMAFLAFAPALLFSFSWLAFAWAVQAAAMAYVAKSIREPLLAGFAYLLIAIAGAYAFLLCLDLYPACWGWHGTRLICLFSCPPIEGAHGAGRYAAEIAMRVLKVGSIPGALALIASWTEPRGVRRFLVGAAVFGAWLFATCEAWMFARCFLPEFRMGAITLAWTLFAIGLLACGIRNRSSAVRKAGLFLFFLAAGKLLILDLAELKTLYRVVASIAVGVLLVSGSFLYTRFRSVFYVEKKDPEDETKSLASHRV